MAANAVTQYAQAVTAGLIVAGPSVRAACRRHLQDLETGHERGWRFDLAKAERAINFFPDVLTVEIDGKVSRFDLLLWQKFVVGSIFRLGVDRDRLSTFRSRLYRERQGIRQNPAHGGDRALHDARRR
jgi:hypothetical protein